MTQDNVSSNSRYSRQMVLPVIGPAGQARLAESSILVLGCGALGSAGAEFAARAGVGRIILVDRDILELHNLQRQLLFDERDVRDRLPKSEAAARHLREINSEIKIEAVITDVTRNNIEDLLASVDLVLDGTDNFATRYLLNDACVKTSKPWVYGGVIGSNGTVMAVRPGKGPCLRCIFTEPPDAPVFPTCETAGVLNTAVAWVAALQFTEALKILVDAPEARFPISSFDIWDMQISSVAAKRNERCPCCGQKQFDFLENRRGPSETVFCGRNAVQVSPEKSTRPDFDALSERLQALGKVFVNGMVLEFEIDGRRLVVFPDGRVLVMGTTEASEARGLVAKYIGA